MANLANIIKKFNERKIDKDGNMIIEHKYDLEKVNKYLKKIDEKSVLRRARRLPIENNCIYHLMISDTSQIELVKDHTLSQRSQEQIFENGKCYGFNKTQCIMDNKHYLLDKDERLRPLKYSQKIELLPILFSFNQNALLYVLDKRDIGQELLIKSLGNRIEPLRDNKPRKFFDNNIESYPPSEHCCCLLNSTYWDWCIDSIDPDFRYQTMTLGKLFSIRDYTVNFRRMISKYDIFQGNEKVIHVHFHLPTTNIVGNNEVPFRFASIPYEDHFSNILEFMLHLTTEGFSRLPSSFTRSEAIGLVKEGADQRDGWDDIEERPIVQPIEKEDKVKKQKLPKPKGNFTSLEEYFKSRPKKYVKKGSISPKNKYLDSDEDRLIDDSNSQLTLTNDNLLNLSNEDENQSEVKHHRLTNTARSSVDDPLERKHSLEACWSQLEAIEIFTEIDDIGNTNLLDKGISHTENPRDCGNAPSSSSQSSFPITASKGADTNTHSENVFDVKESINYTKGKKKPSSSPGAVGSSEIEEDQKHFATNHSDSETCVRVPWSSLKEDDNYLEEVSKRWKKTEERYSSKELSESNSVIPSAKRQIKIIRRQLPVTNESQSTIDVN